MNASRARPWFAIGAIGSVVATGLEWGLAAGPIDDSFATGVGWIIALGFVCTAVGTYLFHGARRGDPFHTAPFAVVLAQLTLTCIGAMLTAPVTRYPWPGRAARFVYGAVAVGGLVLAFAAVIGVFVWTQLEALDRRRDARDRVEFAAARWARLAMALAVVNAVAIAPLRERLAVMCFIRAALSTIATAMIAGFTCRDVWQWRWVRRVARGAVPGVLLATESVAPPVPRLVSLVGNSWEGVPEALVIRRRRPHPNGVVYRTPATAEDYEPWASFPGTVPQLDDVFRTRVVLDVVMLAACAVILALSTK